MTTCPLCGYEFNETALTCVAICPMAALQGCSLICCPNCGYQMVDERKSKLAQALRRILKPDTKQTKGFTEFPSK
jgi:hypothetical protein